MYCTEPKIKTISRLKKEIRNGINVRLMCSSLFPYVKEPSNGTLNVQTSNGDIVAVSIYGGQIKRVFK